MNWQRVLKIVCLTVIGLPQLIAATQGVSVPPMAMLVIGVLNMAAGLTLSELQPGFSATGRPTALGLADDIFDLPLADRKALIDEVERRAKIEGAELISRPPEWLPPERR